MKPRLTYFISFICVVCSLADGQDFSEAIKLVAPDRESMDYFGENVSISGNYAIVGAPWEDAGEGSAMQLAGSAYIFERDYEGNWNWIQKIVASDHGQEDHFGSSVCISANYAIIGAPYDDEDIEGNNPYGNAGSVYIFKRSSAGEWIEEQKIVASDRAEFDFFGIAVSISGKYAIVGASYEDEDTSGGNTLEYAGSAYIFKCDEQGNWTEVQKIVASDRNANDEFGCSISISGNNAIVGANHEDEDSNGLNTLDDAGSVYIYERIGEDNWNEIQKIVASDRNTYDQFGYSISVSGNYAIVGAPDEDEDESGDNTLSSAGSAYIFERNEGGIWNEVRKIVPSDRSENDFFGKSVGISDHYAVIGASLKNYTDEGLWINQAGAAYIIEHIAEGNWIEADKLLASDRDTFDYFGNSVSVSGDYALIGANRKDMEEVKEEDPNADAGAAYLFETCSRNPLNDPENIIVNGDFETCMLNPWSLYLADWAGVAADAVIADGTCVLNLFSLADSPELWHFQLNQLLNSEQLNMLEIGAIYEVSFDARAETTNRHCRVYFGQDDDPWQEQILEELWINDETETYTYSFTLSAINTSMRLTFETGTELPAVVIDNVKLIKLGFDGDDDGILDHLDNCPDIPNTDQADSDLDGIGDVCDNTTNYNNDRQYEPEVRIFPNPARDLLYIEFQNGTDKTTCIELHEISGEIVYSESPKACSSTIHRIDLSSLEEGIYIIRISNAAYSVTRKLIKAE